MQAWFGKRGTGGAYKETPQTETPVGVKCLYCIEAIQMGDDGWIYSSGQAVHSECNLRMIVGSVAHQQRRCSCFGGSGSDGEDGMTRRQAAIAACEHFERHPRQPAVRLMKFAGEDDK
jgi:hypothetical protein